MLVSTKQVIEGCLKKIARGQLDAVLVLVDALDDSDDAEDRRKGRVLADLVGAWVRRCAWFLCSEEKWKRKYARWEAVASNHRYLRQKIKEMFSRRSTDWKRKISYHDIAKINEPLEAYFRAEWRRHHPEPVEEPEEVFEEAQS